MEKEQITKSQREEFSSTNKKKDNNITNLQNENQENNPNNFFLEKEINNINENSFLNQKIDFQIAGQPCILLITSDENNVNVTQVIIYRGIDNFLHCLSSSDDIKWFHQNINCNIMNAPKALSDPIVYCKKETNKNIYYIEYEGLDGKKYQLTSFDNIKTWNCNCISNINIIQKEKQKNEEKSIHYTTITFQIKASFGDLSSIIKIPCIPSNCTVKQLIQRVLKRFPEDMEQDCYLTAYNKKKNLKIILDQNKFLSEYNLTTDEILELRKINMS